LRDSQKECRKSSRNQRMHETQKKKAWRLVHACTVRTHILELRLEKCGFIA
jgi:pantothenate synthetase